MKTYADYPIDNFLSESQIRKYGLKNFRAGHSLWAKDESPFLDIIDPKGDVYPFCHIERLKNGNYVVRNT